MKASYATVDEIPDAQREEYVERDGEYHLNIEGTPTGFATAADFAASQGKVVEFRDRNVALLKHAASIVGLSEVSDLSAIEAKLAEFKDIDPAKHRQIQAQLTELEGAGVKKGSDVSQLVDDKVAAALDRVVAPLKEALDTEKAAREQAQARADTSTMRESVAKFANTAGVIPEAMDFILSQAGQAFEVRDGAVIASGQQFSRLNPGEPLGVAEWMETATQQYDFAFKKSGGGGAEARTPGNKTAAGARELRNPDPFELGRNIDDIVAGKVVPVNDATG